MTEGIEAVKEAKAFLDGKCPTCGRCKADLIMSDVPKDTLKLWKDFANSDEFTCGSNKGGHYGFALKFLLDFYIGRVPNGFDELNGKIEDILEELNTSQEQIPEEKALRRTVSGKELKVGG